MSGRKISRREVTLAGLGLGLGLGSSARGQVPDVPPEIRARRRGWLSGRTHLEYREIYKLFEYAKVDAAGHFRPLPKHPAPSLNFTYELDGQQMAAEGFAERTYTLGLLILKKGRIVTELYRAGATEHSPLYSASMSKTVGSILMGIAVSQGAVRSVDQQVVDYLPELKGTGYDGVSIRQLLRMRSGNSWEDDFTVPGPAKQIQADSLFDNVRRYTDAARDMKRDHEPGTHFCYNSVDAAVAGLVVERATAQDLVKYTSEKLWKPAGMEAPAYWIMDGPPGIGHAFVAGGFNAVLRDYARLGQMMLQGGIADGRRVLPKSWVADSNSMPAGEPQPGGLYGYGYFWWLLAGTQAYTAMGGGGQYIYINPTYQTVIVKASSTMRPPQPPAGAPAEQMPWDRETQAFFNAAAKWQPT